MWSRDLDAGSAVHGLLATPAYDGHLLFVPSASPPNGLFGLTANGATAWSRATDLPVYSAPAAGRGVVVFGTGAVFGDLSRGSVVAVSATDGHVLWSFDAHSAVRGGPAVAGTLVAVGDAAGDLMAFRPRI
jgi:outer membrane protein assembly factor BamB